MSAACPVCQRVIYSRRQRTCGYCDADLPPEALFSPQESAQVTRTITEMEARRHRELEAEERKKRRSDPGGRGIYGPGIY
ncbi:hypothetical protein BH09VER1_BH09VER1_01610 [soil metagenome]